MHDVIMQRLSAIQQADRVKLLFAIESGSRAWGFASTDSDWDVRFVYVRPLEGYLTVYPERSVIETPLVDDLDVNGWDVRKALHLLRKSNPTLLEWLDSPIRYAWDQHLLEPLLDLVPQSYNALASCHHYLSMASHQNSILISGEGVVRRKKYLYILRALLAARWSIQREDPPPMEFDPLLGAFPTPQPVLDEIAELLTQKRAGTELSGGSRSAILDTFTADLRAEIEARLPAKQDPPPVEPYDLALRETIRRAWG
jgi:uncharacterized protein